ncbi:MAG: hypothetical protein ACRDTN_13195 [Mycobacterium sp.]
MTRHHSTRPGRSRCAKAPRRGRVLGLGTIAGAFSAALMVPLTTLPAAHADFFDLDDMISDLIGNFGLH